MAASTDMLHDGLMKLLHLLYEKDILGEDVIMKWYNSGVGESSVATALRKQVISIWCLTSLKLEAEYFIFIFIVQYFSQPNCILSKYVDMFPNKTACFFKCYLAICIDEFVLVFSSVPFWLCSSSTCFMNNFIWYWCARTTQMFVCHKACFSKLLGIFLTALCVTNSFWMIVIKFIFDMSVDPFIMSTPEKKWHIFSATEDLFSDVAFNAIAPLTPHFGHIWKQTNKQTNYC